MKTYSNKFWKQEKINWFAVSLSLIFIFVCALVVFNSILTNL